MRAVLAALALAVAARAGLPEELESALSRGAHAEVEARCRARLVEAPDDRDAAAGLVRALLGQDAWQQARSVSRAHGEVALAEVLYRAGELEELERHLPSTDPASLPPRTSMVLGLLRVAQGRVEEGNRALESALARAPGDPDVVFAAAGAASTRARAAELLARFLAFPRQGDEERREAAEGSSRLQRALGERPTWVPLAQPDRLEIPLRPLPDGAGGTRGYVLDADLGGKRAVPLLLDSGSGGLFLVARTVKRQAVPLSEETVFAGGGTGRQASRRALLPRVSLAGALAWKDALVTLADREIEPTGRYLGVLGLSVFDGYRVTLDLGAPKVVLERGARLDGGEPYWVVQGQWLVRASASGTPGLYLLDTGAGTSSVSWEAARGAGVELGSVQGGPRPRGYSGGLAARWARGMALRFGGRSTTGGALPALDLAQRSRLGGVEVSGHVGLDLLAGRRLVLDTVGQRLEIGGP